MDHSKRERVMSQSCDIKCELTLAENQAAIHIEVSGREKVPLKLEVIASAMLDRVMCNIAIYAHCLLCQYYGLN